MLVQVDRCRQAVYTGACTVIDSVRDEGNYEYWAGPRSINAAGFCIRVTGAVEYGTDIARRSVVGHCG
ncbi:hypothetical protein ACFW2D_29490 [Streptomyces sp. NPDC058914]|uniref:hypothetical protein n=1 Tax=Streptomyces TaxID=1883 RepID=UPI0036CCD3D0